MEGLLVDTMLFFDGRCGYDMGAFSQVYTRAYKRCATGESKVTLTGLGGEMYRNHSHSALPYTYFPEWLKAHIYYSSALFAMKDRRLHAQLSNTIINKINARLDQDYGGWVDHLALRRYYSELRMPESNGVNHNAHNQLSFYLTPFIEKEIISEAYQATPYLGFSGTYEASLIEKISPDLAAEQSHYGFPLTHEPFSYKARCFIRGIIPDAISNYRYFFDRKYRNRGALNLQRYLTAVSRCGYLRSVNELLNRSFPEIDWDELVRDNLASPTVTHVGTFLLEYQHKIIFNQEI
jgi:hypothetical protein